MQLMEETTGPRAWIIWSLGGSSVALILAGVLMLPRALAAPAPPIPAGEPASARDTTPIQGRKSPDAFGLPTYPDGFAFFSLETDAQSGSCSYSVKQGTVPEITRHYQRELARGGWQFVKETRTAQLPGDAKAGTQRRADGLQIRWVHPQQGKQLELTALDLRQKGSTAQVLLSWFPLE